MGLERIAAVLQGKHDNYDTDILRALIVASAEASHVAADGKQAVVAPRDRRSSARELVPHRRRRAAGKEGRGYVLRRIMRRAMRHAHLLGTEEPLLWRLVPALVRQMGAAYPELGRAEALITETLKLEETGFRETLARGLKLLDEEEGNLPKGKEFPGEIAFKLYDTFGFPLDLTEDVLRGRGRKVDDQGVRPCHGTPARGGAQILGRLGRGRHRPGVARIARETGRDRIPGLRGGREPKARSRPSSSAARA